MQTGRPDPEAHLDTTALEGALEGSCPPSAPGCSLEGFECHEDECFVATSEYEINPSS